MSGLLPGAATALLLLLALVPPAGADPQPGDVWRRALWRGPFLNADGWQRVTDDSAAARGARAFLPNPTNRVTLEDLAEVTRVEARIEYWGGHVGTGDKAIRVNGGAWHDLPRLQIPGPAGRLPGAAPECYMHFSYASVDLPLDELLEGANTFEFHAGPQICGGFGWGQWGVYGVSFHLYHDADSLPHPAGRLLSPAPGATVGDSLVIEVEASSPNGPIESVDIIALYEDFDFEGNGLWRQWHATTRYGKLYRHVGTRTEAPWRFLWDTAWVPDQQEPVYLVARLKDSAGVYALTEAVPVSLERSGRTVRLYRPYDVPTNWVSRASRWQSSEVFVPESLEQARAARMVLTTWSGGHADSVGVNRQRLLYRAGPAHDHGYITADVPLDFLRSGSNRFFTAASTLHHGIEVMWPGIALLVEYEGRVAPPRAPQADILLFGDELRPGWRAATPEDGGVEEGDHLRLDVTSHFRDLLTLRGPPQSLQGVRALRLDVHPGELRTADYQSLDAVIWDWEGPIIDRGEGRAGLDLGLAQWQTIELPIDRAQLQQPYFDDLTFAGRLDGVLGIDNVRLVVDPGTAVTERATATPDRALLGAPFPNPFNASVIVPVTLSATAGPVALTVYDIAGQRIASLARDLRGAGTHRLRWDGRSDSGHGVASGVYVVVARTRDNVSTRRLVLLR